MMVELVLVALLALALGLLAGWLAASRNGAQGAADLAAARVHAGQVELTRTMLQEVTRERDDALRELDRHCAGSAEREAGMKRQLDELLAAKDQLSRQFAEVGQQLLHQAQERFLQRADERFKEAETASGQSLKALLQPVHDRLERYEKGVEKVETDRQAAFGLLHGQISAMREDAGRVSSQAANLVNALRNAPKARGNWGERQLRNVLEQCGLSEHTDFETEVSVDTADGRQRPDAIVKVPGGKALVIDAKVSLNAYQDAINAVDDDSRAAALDAHAASVRTHMRTLADKAYWNQFAEAPDYVIMFIPGEHFLSAALDHDGKLWDHAFERRVLLATPTNLVAIARTVSAVWRQEKLAGQAREIAELGKELYARLAVMGGHVSKLGRNLELATGAYNSMVGSLEAQVFTQARRFEALNIETAERSIETPALVEQQPRPLIKLATSRSDEQGARAENISETS